MLSASILRNAEYHLRLAREDYYTKGGGEPKGKWIGSVAGHFGLEGKPVRNRQLRQLLDGYSPKNAAQKLVQNAGSKKRQKGWDLTFSAPKEVSLLWAAASQSTRKRISKCQQEAVKASVGYLEQHAVLSRRGKDGVDLERGRLLVAAFEHSTSRAEDPNLHTHCLVSNLCQRIDGTFGTLNSSVTEKTTYNSLLRHIKAGGAIYRTELAFQLERLGFSIDSEQDGVAFRVSGVPREAVDFHSTRRKQIETELTRVGFRSKTASRIATLATRNKKLEINRQELFGKWRGELNRFGLTEEKVDQLCQRATQRAKFTAVDEAVNVASDILTRERSSFTRKELTEQVANYSQRWAVSSKQVLERINYEIENGRLVSLGCDANNERVLATQGTLQLEDKFIKLLYRAKKDLKHQLPAAFVESTLAQRRRHKDVPLNDEQVNALRYIVTGKNEAGHSGGALRIINGDAGSGKTTMLKAARQTLEKAGYKVRGACLAGVAAERLEADSGIESSTIKKWVNELAKHPVKEATKHQGRMFGRVFLKKHTWHLERKNTLDDKTAIIIDESVMAESDLLYEFQQKIEEAGALAIWVGDPKQLQSVGHGGAVVQAERILGAVRLQENLRQVHPEDKLVARLASEGKGGEALRNLAERGRVVVDETEDEAMKRLVEDWSTSGGVENPKDHQVFVSTNQQRLKLNDKLQKARIGGLQKLLRAGITNFEGQQLYAGDRVCFRETISFFHPDKSIAGKLKLEAKKVANKLIKQTFKPKRETVRRGAFGTVLSIASLSDTMRIAMDDGRMLDVPLHVLPHEKRRLFPTPKPIRRLLRQKTPIALAYATTTHLSQGGSFPFVYSLVGGSMTNTPLSYVQLSRAKYGTKLYTSEAEAGEELTLISLIRDAERRGDKQSLKSLSIDLSRLEKSQRVEQSQLARKFAQPRLKEFALPRMAEYKEARPGFEV